MSYRPVSLCNVCKGFSYILNKRLLTYLESNNILVEEQNGSRKGRSCQDHIFSLFSIIKSRINKKKHTFCCFVGYFAAFDFVDRTLLIYALKNVGVDGPFLKVIQEMYRNTLCAVKVNNKVTDWFSTYAGLRQGQNDSPTAFAAFVNSLAVKINVGISVGKVKMSIVLFADDIVLLGETEQELQIMINELHVWCKTWRMKVNCEKTQIVHFRPKKQSKTVYNFRLGNEEIRLVDKY